MGSCEAMQILVVEDDPKIAEFLRRGLRAEGYSLEVAGDGQAALDAAQIEPPGLVILDLLLPRVDGLTVCRSLRTRWPELPILILTARDAVADRVVGLDCGADDYLVKPFAFEELLARVRALLRRHGADRSPQLQVADLLLDPATHRVTRGGRPVSLTAREFALLAFLMRNTGRVLSRVTLESGVWGYDYHGASNVVDVYIRHLRKKIDEGSEIKLIHTLRGVGYLMREDRDEAP